MFGLVNMSGEEFSLNSGEKPAWSFRMFRITSRSGAHLGWMFSFGRRHASIYYLNRL